MIILLSNFKNDDSPNKFRDEECLCRVSVKLFHKTSTPWGSFHFSRYSSQN